MTTGCPGGGPSQAIPGFSQQVVVTSAAVEAALTLFGLEPLALVLAPFIAGETYTLTTFCTANPPTPVTLTETDIIDVTNFTDPTVSIPAIQKCIQWFNSWYWYQVCECVTAPTPAAPIPTAPGVSVTTNAGLPGAPPTPCFSATQLMSGVQATGNTGPTDITTKLLPTNGASVSVSGCVVGSIGGATLPLWPIPAGITKIDFLSTAVQVIPSDTGGAELVAAINFANSSGTHIGGQAVGQAQNADKTTVDRTLTNGTSPWLSTAAYYGVAWAIPGSGFGSPDTNPQALSLTTNVACNGLQLSQPCCPPDPQVLNELQQLLGLVTAIYQAIPTPITSYADATAHTGLHDNGTLTLVDSPIAIRVNITTDVNKGDDLGSPTYLFDRGYIVPIVNLAPIAGQTRLVFDPQQYLLPTLTEQIGYSLTPGLVVTVTELVRGP